MILYKELSWWYWAAITLLLAIGLAGWFEAFYLALALGVEQAIHFRLREGRFAAFPVQVRVAYAAILMLAVLGPIGWLFWLLGVGNLAQILFGYCVLARCLSLLPWNRRESLSWRVAWRTFAAAPVKGNILQGLPASK